MRKIYLLLIVISFANCQNTAQKNEVKKVDSPLKAEIIKKGEIFIILTDTSESFSTNLRLDEFQDRPDLLEFGRINGPKTITIPTENEIEINGGNGGASFQYNLKLEKGDSLNISLEKVRLDENYEIIIPIFHISNTDRKGSELNFGSLLYKKNLETKAIGIDTTKSFLFTYWKSEKIYQNAIFLLDSLKSRNNISEKFYLNEKDTQKYEFVSKKLREETIGEQGLDNLMIIGDDKISLNRKDQLDYRAYISLLRQLIDKKYFNDKRELNSKKFDYVLNNTTFLNDEQKIAVLDSYLKSIFFVEKNIFEKYLDKFILINSEPELEKKWSKVLTNLELNQKKLNNSNRNIGLLLNMVNDNQLTFEEILQKQEGNVILIDFWASWCAPCIQEIPAMKNLKSIFENDKFQVIQISIDKDYAAWERVSKLVGLDKDENSLIISNWEESNLHKTYSIKAIPRYLLFDKEGKIITDDAPRPSSKELEELIKASI